MVVKVTIVILGVVIGMAYSQISVDGERFHPGGGDFQYNSGSGSRQYQTGGSGYGLQVDRDPSGTSTQFQNGNVNYPGGSRYNGPSSGGFGGGRPYGGGSNVNVNGRDYSGRDVNEPGLQVNHSPRNYQF